MNLVLPVDQRTIWLVTTTVMATALAVAIGNLALVMLYKNERDT
jgi:hypothetical protein